MAEELTSGTKLFLQEFEKVAQPLRVLDRRFVLAHAPVRVRGGLRPTAKSFGENLAHSKTRPRLTILGNEAFGHDVPAPAYTFGLSARRTGQDYSKHSKSERSPLTWSWRARRDSNP